MVIFHSYVSLPEGMSNPVIFQGPHPSEAMSCQALASGPPHHPIGSTMVFVHLNWVPQPL